jgi:hypothetical protein
MDGYIEAGSSYHLIVVDEVKPGIIVNTSIT